MGRVSKDVSPDSQPTSQRVVLRAGPISFSGMFSDKAISRALLQQLPISSTVNRWGDEIYFEVPVKMRNVQPTMDVKVGDIAYWPEGPCLCIFFGRTPASQRGEPRPASEVTIIGHTDTSVEHLRSITEGMKIVLDYARATQNPQV